MQIYVLSGIVLVSLITGFGAAWQTQNWRYGAKENERRVAQQRDTLKRIDRVDEAAFNFEQDKTKVENQHAEIVKIVTKFIDRPIYHNVCIDDDGVSLLNSYIAGRAGEVASKSPAAVPRSSASK